MRTIDRGFCWSVAALVLLLTGTSSAADCDIRLSEREVDYGRLHRGELLDEQPGQRLISLEKRTLTLSVTCQRPSVINLRFNALSAEPQTFSFGQRGNFSVVIGDALVDGQAATWLHEHKEAQTAATRQTFEAGQSLVALIAGVPARARVVTAQIEVQARLAAQETHVSDETRIEAIGAFELIGGE